MIPYTDIWCTYTNVFQNRPFTASTQLNTFGIYDSLNNPIWTANVSSNNIIGAYVALQNNGNLVLYDSASVGHWYVGKLITKKLIIK